MSDLALDIQRAAEIVRAATDVTLLAHVRPDPDALGSALALGRVLRENGATVRVSFGYPDELPDRMRYLDPDGLYVPAAELPEGDGLLVALDTPSPKRLGVLGERVATAREVLVIDHHASNEFYGTHHVVDVTAEATAVLVLRVIDELGAVLDEPVARGLYAGLVTDTSGFRRASAATHQAAARLIEAGVDPDRLAREIMDDHPFAWLPMLSSVLASARLEPEEARGFGLVHAVVRAADAATVREEEVEDVIDVVRGIRDAEVAVVLKEYEPERWTISLRAVGRIDVSAVARALGGGGHRLAAGCEVDGAAEQVLDKIRAALRVAPLL